VKKNNSKKRITRMSIKKNRVLNIVLLIVTLICVSINIVLLLNKFLIPRRESEVIYKEKLNKKMQLNKTNSDNVSSEQNQLEFLKKGTERDRIEYYCGQFFKNIENKNYERAYQVLYPEFKQQYFPTIEDFEKYVQKTYPSVLAINYDDFDRQGDIYITTVLVDNALAKDNSKQFSQRIVVQESDYNKYVLSFQVI
jgi:hypothetical protein